MTDIRQVVLSAAAGVLPVREMRVLDAKDRELLEAGLGERTRRLLASIRSAGLREVPTAEASLDGGRCPDTALPLVAWFDQLGEGAIEELSAPKAPRPPPTPAPPPHPTVGGPPRVPSARPATGAGMWASYLGLEHLAESNAGAKVFPSAESYLTATPRSRVVEFALFVSWVAVQLGYNATRAKSVAECGALVERIDGQLAERLWAGWQGASVQSLSQRATAAAPKAENAVHPESRPLDPLEESRRTGWALMGTMIFMVVATMLALSAVVGGGLTGEVQGALERGGGVGEGGQEP